MNIQLNAGKNVTHNKEIDKKFTSMISAELDRYDDIITRLEVHLSDVDGNKNSENDKRCLIEARLKGLQPIAVSDKADTHEFAVIGAVEKLKSSLLSIQDRSYDRDKS